MAGQYSKNFTLTDIFNNKKLKNKIPLINYKEKRTEDDKVVQRTNITSVRKRVFDTAILSAKPFYLPMITIRTPEKLIIDGDLIGEHDEAVNAVYNSIKNIRSVLIWTANNSNIIRHALKEAERNKNNFGLDSKLYLRAQSMQQIEGMSRSQLQALLENVMENIFYGDNFPETQKKFGIDKIQVSSKYNYKQRVENWKRKVGAL